MEASRDVQERCLVLGRERTKSDSWSHRGTRNLNTKQEPGSKMTMRRPVWLSSMVSALRVQHMASAMAWGALLHP